MNDLTRQTASPFDSIRQVRPDGSEYWSARRLQSLMGYAAWRNFQPAIARAMQTASNTGMDVAREFLQVGPVAGSRNRSTGGQFQGGDYEDYELSRRAAHLVSMNGDPNKPEVAAAQVYFSRRTEQAEAIEADLSGLPDWARREIGTIVRVGKIEAEQRQQELEIIRQAKELLEHRARLDSIEGQHGWYTALGFARLKAYGQTDEDFLKKVGRRAGVLTREAGLEPGKAPHARYGTHNTYPEWALERAFGEMAVAS